MKWFGLILVLILLTATFPFPPAQAADNTEAENTRPTTVEEAIQRINRDMKEYYGLDNYFPESIPKDGQTLKLRKDLIEKD